jgi:4,4'-diaponeurosporenoate glycosyltransferase
VVGSPGNHDSAVQVKEVSRACFDDDEFMSRIDVGIFAVGWMIGWLLLWRERPLPGATRESAVAVVVPARDEAHAIGDLLSVLREQLVDGDELLVVDDHSSDDTAGVARRYGTAVITAPDLPAGWLGKPHACWIGAHSTSAPTLLFIDADVTPAPDLIDRIGAAVESHAESVVSVQPWHRTVGVVEQASMLCNITALMGSGAFTIAADHGSSTVAFGPVLALDRTLYERLGGHRAVRSMHTEDIGLARAAGSSIVYTGRADTTFRMYPNGARELLDGWTRSIATGARLTRWPLTFAIVCWVAAIAGGWTAGGWPTNQPALSAAIYALSAAQLWILGRRAGSMHPLTAMLFPIAVVVFVLIFLRSLVIIAFGRNVPWKGRAVAAADGAIELID